MKTITIKKETITTNEGWSLARLNKPYLFTDSNNNGVYTGDCVSFYVDDDYMQRTGYIQKLDGYNIKIDCFDIVFNKWYQYDVE